MESNIVNGLADTTARLTAAESRAERMHRRAQKAESEVLRLKVEMHTRDLYVSSILDLGRQLGMRVMGDTTGGLTPYGITLNIKARAEKAEARVRELEAGGAIALIAAERQRQVAAEGWTPEHDDGHADGEMAEAAACYALPPDLRQESPKGPQFWPWDAQWWKPSPNDRIRELVKAGALIAAEIDRLQRVANQNTTPQESRP